ncbi:MAG: 2-oxo acid dehydrogenase subunit E2 [Dehalococcoidia bacterium]|nr:2-oxo acid dehydrogenase subunit E2 [Dehalococcoidia bacterium]
MATEVLIPKLGMTMTEGTVAEWLIPDGGHAEAGEIVFRLETEKIEFQVEAEAAGTVRHLVPAGTTLEPGTVVAYILAEGEALPAGAGAAPAAAPAAAAPPPATAATPQAAAPTSGELSATPIARRLAREAGIELAAIQGTGPGGRIVEADVRAAIAAPKPAVAPRPAPQAAPGREAPASPLARKRAEALGVDLATVTGTGPGGRITVEDVEAAHSAPAPVPAPAAPRVTAPPAGGDWAPAPAPGQVIPVRGMRKAIATRMYASLQESAQLTMGMDVEMDEAIRLRTQLVEEWSSDGVRVTYTDLVIRAAAKALQRHPNLNARYSPEAITLEADVHMGMAVALDDGLVVPVIRNAGVLPLKEISRESSRVAAAAREGKLGMDEMSGSTFTITALGASGVDFFTPIINPPNVAILGVGQIRDGVGWDGDRPVRRRVLTLSLTIDHRAVDGAPGAMFLAEVRDLLQAPYRLLV